MPLALVIVVDTVAKVIGGAIAVSLVIALAVLIVRSKQYQHVYKTFLLPQLAPQHAMTVLA